MCMSCRPAKHDFTQWLEVAVSHKDETHCTYAWEGTVLIIYAPTQTNRSSVNEMREINEPRHEISNDVVCATSKASDQPAHTRSLI